MTEKEDMRHKDSAPRDDRKDAKPADAAAERQHERQPDQPGAAHAGATARADEYTYD
jgi:hypothetical protein